MSWLIRDEHWHIAPARVARTELAVAVFAPTVGLATRRDGTRVVATRKDGREDLIRADRQWMVTAQCDRSPRRGGAGLRGRRAELATPVLAPTLRRIACPDS